MIEHLPAIVVSLPSRNVREAVAEIDLARRLGANIAEIRLDRWTPQERGEVGRLFPAPLPLLATYRSRTEGGEGADDPLERAGILEGLATYPFRWIDLEYDRDRPLLDRLPAPDRLGRIVSSHLSVSRPEDWAARERELAGLDAVGKLVLPATVLDVFRELLPRLPPRGEGALIVHTTGPSGPLLRALSRRLRLPMVFAALPADAGSPPVEASQIPVDRLRPFLDAADPAPLFAVTGHPVAHSKSPALHSSWMRADHRDGLYVPLDFATEEEFVESLPFLAASGFLGLNVTHPLKRVALAAATDVRAGATACGVANCLTFRDGKVEADNTDLAAILRRLGELRDAGRWDGHALTVVGAGGSARATLAAANTLSARVIVHARRIEEAQALASEFGSTAARPGETRPASLVVNATTVGRGGSGPPDVLIDRLVAPGGHVLDWVYAPDEPPIVDAARAAGATYEDGTRLLVYQAAASYALWWGNEPDPDAVESAAKEGVCTG